MAGQQQYYEEPADQEYYGQEEVPAGSTGEDLTALASVPWVAIALAVHVILLVIAWFILPTAPERVQVEVIQAQQEQIELPLGLRFGPVAIGGQHPAETERVAHHEGVEFVHVLAAKSEGPPYSGEPSLLVLKEIVRGT